MRAHLLTYIHSTGIILKLTSNSSVDAGWRCEAEDNWDCDGGGEESIGGVEVPGTSSDWLSVGGEKLDTTSIFAD